MALPYSKRVCFFLARLLRFGRRETIIEQSGLLVAVAVMIGLVVSVMMWLLEHLVDALVQLCGVVCRQIHDFHFRAVLVFLLPLMGFVIASIIYKRYKAEKSLTNLIYAMNRERVYIPGYERCSHLLASAFSVGMGGSAGLEAPGVLTGVAVASSCSDFLCIRGRARLILQGCGAAAAISAIFRSPLAGILFTIEALLPSLPMTVLAPLLVSSLTAFLLMVYGFQASPVYFLSGLNMGTSGSVWLWIGCGIFSALVGWHVIASTAATGRWIRSLQSWGKCWFFVVSLLTCALLFAFPVLRGSGHHYMEYLFMGDSGEITGDMWLWGHMLSPRGVLILTLLAGVLVKPMVSIMSIQCGDGGIFAPTLLIGATWGFLFGQIINGLGWADVQVGNFVALGMCGVFSVVMRSPLTAVFLVAEATGNVNMVVPLAVVSTVAWFMGRFLAPSSIYRRPLVLAGLVSDDRVASVLMNMPVDLCMKRGGTSLQAPSIRSDSEANAALALMKKEKCSVLNVVDTQERFVGTLSKEEILDKYLATSLNH